MITSPENSQQDTEEVRAFFEQWAVYRKIVDLDYLSHRGAYAAIDTALAGLGHPFSFLDLGAGDADSTSRVLAGKPLSSYEAVDLSETALRLARERTSDFRCAVRCTQGDFFQFVKNRTLTDDVVFIGLSLHHLIAEDKRRFLPELRRIVSPGGMLLVYEPIREPGESRDEVMARWWRHAQSHWTGIEPAELTKAKEHVFGNDHPEPIADYIDMMTSAGFSSPRVLFTDPQQFYAVIEADA
jgi:ubiquinone/menaquinone biosynthesis C-methylase UbiE